MTTSSSPLSPLRWEEEEEVVVVVVIRHPRRLQSRVRQADPRYRERSQYQRTLPTMSELPASNSSSMALIWVPKIQQLRIRYRGTQPPHPMLHTRSQPSLGMLQETAPRPVL